MTEEQVAEAIVVHDSGNLLAASTGRELVDRATERATALADVIAKQQLFVNLSGRRHVKVEGWTLLGSMMGVFPVTDTVTELRREDGSSFGFEARVEARTLAGALVGAAIARCTRDEKNWDMRKGVRVDDYALMSMAQTRATSKALRMPLGYVMQLAGFEATPAEEIPAEEPHQTPEVGSPEYESQRRNIAFRKIKDAIAAKGPTLAEHAQEIARRLGVPTLAEASAAQAEDVAAHVIRFVETGELPEPPGAPEDGSVVAEPPPADDSLTTRIRAAAVASWKPDETEREAHEDPHGTRATLIMSACDLIAAEGWDEAKVREILGAGPRRSVPKALAEGRITDLETALKMLEAAAEPAL